MLESITCRQYEWSRLLFVIQLWGEVFTDFYNIGTGILVSHGYLDIKIHQRLGPRPNTESALEMITGGTRHTLQ